MTLFDQPLRELIQIDGAIATPTVACPASRTFTGVIYDSYGLICRLAQRTRCGNNEWHPSDPETISVGMPMRTVLGRSLYLGHYTGTMDIFCWKHLPGFGLFTAVICMPMVMTK
jgi:hypothetical protein